MAPATVARVLDRASRGETLARAAAAEAVDLAPGVDLDACHEGKPVCTVRPLGLIGALPVFAEFPAAPSIQAARRDALARALARPVAFLGAGSWCVVAP
jgi:hypothetical protein